MLPTKRILLIIPGIPFGQGIAMGIQAYCHLNGHWEYHLERNDDQDLFRRAKGVIRQWKVDGIIAAFQSKYVQRVVRSANLPTVGVDCFIEKGTPTVRLDHVAAGRMVAKYFMENGFKHFAFCEINDLEFSRRRCAGFVEALSKAHLDCDVLATETVSNWVSRRRRMNQWLLSLKKPVAIMCTVDLFAQEVAWACQELGLRVPEDVAIVGMGNDEFLCQMCNPPLSSVDSSRHRIGYEAAHLLDGLLHGVKPPAKPVLIAPGQVVVRQSSNILALDDPDIATAIRFIRKHAYEPIRVQDILQEVPISRRALELRFAKIIGRTPMAEIAHIRMERAKTLLGETPLPMPAVAQKSGFATYALFSASFRNKLGMTPTQYRRSMHAGTPGAMKT
jgi:LacI family transcriptional regulator